MSDASRLMYGGTVWLEESVYKKLDPGLTKDGMKRLERLLEEVIICGPIRIHVYKGHANEKAHLGPRASQVSWQAQEVVSHPEVLGQGCG